MNVIEYANRFSHGPVGYEYPFPTNAAQFPAWYTQFADLDSSDVKKLVTLQWATEERCVAAIAECLSTYEARSLYYLPCEWSDNHYWLLLHNEKNVLFIPEPSSSCPAVNAPPDLLRVLETFDGYQFGFNLHPEENFLRCDSGFVPRSRLVNIRHSDEKYLWELDETVLGGVWFFSTSCGNRFYCRHNGSVAKWNHENCEIEDVFESVNHFAEAFTQYYMHDGSGENSPFYY